MSRGQVRKACAAPWNASPPAQRWPEQEIARNYRLTIEQVRPCVAYAQERLNEEKVFAIVECSP